MLETLGQSQVEKSTLLAVAQLCEQQQSYLLACKKYMQVGFS
jgi:hypothetical protein